MVGKISFGNALGRSESEAGAVEFSGPVHMETVENTVIKLAEYLRQKKGFSCYVLGDGGMPSGTYDELMKEVGVVVLAKSSKLPFPLVFLRRLVASECGLVKLCDVTALPSVFERLTEQSMAIIFVIPVESEQIFVKRVKKKDSNFGFDYGMRVVEDHIIYLVDTDSFESETGVVEYFSCGFSFKNDLSSIFRFADSGHI